MDGNRPAVEIERVPYSEYTLGTLQWWRERVLQVGDREFARICTRAIKCKQRLMAAAAERLGVEVGDG